jgi:hypothetical protein
MGTLATVKFPPESTVAASQKELLLMTTQVPSFT